MDTSGAVLHSVQRLLSRLSFSSDAAEMALVGIVSAGRGPQALSGSRPLLVFHCQLRQGEIADMRSLLDSDAVTQRNRKLHDRQVYEFTAGSPQLGAVEVVLAERDLVVSNHRPTLSRVLDPRTTANRGFASSQRFQRLRKRVATPPGSVLVYADWKILVPKLDGLFAGDADWMMKNSGVQVPEQLMFVARPAPRRSGQKRGIITSVLLHHASDSYKFSTEKAPLEAVGEWHPDGWLDLLRPSRITELLAGLPPGGVVSIATKIDIESLLTTHSGRRMRRLQLPIFLALKYVGSDVPRRLIKRLSKVGGVQLLMLGGDKGSPRLAYSMRAKSSRQARDIFRSLEKFCVAHHLAESREAPTKGGQRELRFRSLWSRNGVVLSVVQDSLVLAFDPKVMQGARETLGRRAQSSRRSAILSRLRRLGATRQKVSGLFALDLGFLAGPEARKKRPVHRFSSLLGLHAGFFTFEKDVVRLEMFTELEIT